MTSRVHRVLDGYSLLKHGSDPLDDDDEIRVLPKTRYIISSETLAVVEGALRTLSVGIRIGP